MGEIAEELCEMLTVVDVRWECSCKSLHEFIYLFIHGWNTPCNNYYKRTKIITSCNSKCKF